MSCEKHGYTNGVYCPVCDLEQEEKARPSPTASELNQGKELTEERMTVLTEERVRNYRAWCAARADTLSGAVVGVALADAWLSSRSYEAPSRRGEGDKPLPFKLPVEKRKTDYGFVIVNATGGYICELGDEADADAIVEALNKNTGAS